jgi:hypothetical protein
MIEEDRIEEELKNALRREQPPLGFAERVLARVHAEDAAPVGFWHSLFGFMHLPRFKVAMATALFLLVLGGTWQYRRYERERQAGEAAREQLLLALQITENKLQHAQQQVNEAGSREFGPATDSEDSQ